MTKNSSDNIVDMLEQFFAKAPPLPPNVKDTLVNITPIIALIFGILGVLGSLSGLGLLTAFSPLAPLGGASAMSSYGTGFLSALLWLASSVLMLAAYPGTKARKMEGWNKLFWSEVISAVSALVTLSLFSGLIGALIGFYLLFQIKSHYK